MKLPHGWKIVKFQEVADNNHPYPIGDGDHGQIKPAMYQKEGIPYVRVGDMVNDVISLKDIVYISEEIHKKNIGDELIPGDVLIAKTGATIGKVAIIPENMLRANTTASIGKITPDKTKLLPKYLLYFMKTKYFTEQMWKVSIKSAQPGFNIRDLKKFNIMLPPIDTQKRIVSVLEKAKQAKQLRKNTNKLTDKYLKSVFYEMFGDTGRNNKKFSLQEIKEVVINTSNEEPSKRYPNEFFNYIDISSIDRNIGRIVSAQKILGKNAPSRAKQKIKYKDILVSTVRPNLNSVALVPLKYDNQICSTGFCILRNDNIKINSDYLFMVTRSNFFIESLVQKCKGAGYPAVSNKDILTLKIPIPPIELQNKFADIVQKVERMKEHQKKSTQELDNLFNALMQKAFKGEKI